jgi:spore germination cell wall hydrolase CwlJ-like protein
LSASGLLILALMIASTVQANVANNTCEKSITYLEARGESSRGIAAVRQVIRNRSRRSGDSVCREVKRKGQFSSYKRGMCLSHVRYDRNFLLKWEESGKVHVLSSDYTHYFRKDIRPDWARSMKCDRVVDHHRFCKDN